MISRLIRRMAGSADDPRLQGKEAAVNTEEGAIYLR